MGVDFDDAPKSVIKGLADANGKQERSPQSDGKYDDMVKGLVAIKMLKGKYDILPNPFKHK